MLCIHTYMLYNVQCSFSTRDNSFNLFITFSLIFSYTLYLAVLYKRICRLSPTGLLINSHFDSSELVDGARRFHWFIGSISILLFLTFGFCFILFPPFFLPQGEVSLSFWDLQYYTMILCRSCRMGRFQEDTMYIFSLLIFSLFTCKIKFKKNVFIVMII